MTRYSRTPFYIAVLLLMVAGSLVAIWRHQTLGVPWLPGKQQPVWLVEARVDFQAWNEPVTLSLNIPDATPGFRILSEQAASPATASPSLGATATVAPSGPSVTPMAPRPSTSRRD